MMINDNDKADDIMIPISSSHVGFIDMRPIPGNVDGPEVVKNFVGSFPVPIRIVQVLQDHGQTQSLRARLPTGVRNADIS